MQNIQKLTDREHILKRPNMYIGGTDKQKTHDFILTKNGFEYTEIQFVPGLIKIINEIIDNSIDVAIKNNFKYGDKINVRIDEKMVEVSDNGTGIPIVSDGEHYLPELCWNHAKSGSNFDDDEKRAHIGMNGVGSYATAVFSTTFIGKTNDGKKQYTIKIVNNAESFTEKIEDANNANSSRSSHSTTMGTTVKFFPDLKKFSMGEMDSIDEVHQNLIKQRLINLSMSYPKINFKFNGKKIRVSSNSSISASSSSAFKSYIKSYFDNFLGENKNDFVIFSGKSGSEDDISFQFGILPNNSDDFKQMTFVNGLTIKSGTLTDTIIDNIVRRLREKLMKKFKSIKPGDIKNKLMIVGFFQNFNNLKFDSQTKEKITNSVRETNEYLNISNDDYDNIVKKILKCDGIISPITETYRLKEELKHRQELKKLKRHRKKIKSEKYLPSTGTGKNRKILMIAEGDSAVGGLSPVLGRETIGYYSLKGKPLNVYSASSSKFMANTELSELYQIIKNEGYEFIIFATDQDLDGIHIRGLLCGFIIKYLPEFKNQTGFLNTPVVGIKERGNGKKLIKWFYSLSESNNYHSAIDTYNDNSKNAKYFKGLGSWKQSDLKYVIETDGLWNMITFIDFNDETIIDEWLNPGLTNRRKEYIISNDFDIAKI